MRQVRPSLHSQDMLAVFVVGAMLWGLWVLLWREPSWPVILAGAAFPLGLWLLRRSGRVRLALPPPFFRLHLWLGFWLTVGLRVAIAVAQTAWAAVTGSISPGIAAVPLRVRSEMAQLLLLWAITVTPGTIALLVEGETLYIHCLHLPPRGYPEGVERLQSLVQRIWG